MNFLNSIAQFALAHLNDELFSSLQYLRRQRRFPNFENPTTLNEQIQWLKVYYRNPLLKACADKYTVRDFVSRQGGNDCLVPLHAVYSSAEEIDFDSLPEQFVLKVSRKKLTRWMESDFYKVGREWAYKGLIPQIVCEEFLCTPDGEPPWDYKFFCFHGEPRYVQVDYGRFTGHTRAIYGIEWKRIPCQLEYALEANDSAKPKTLETMLDLARKVSAPFPFVRVDLYELLDRVFFGELTFYPGKGVERFTPREFDRVFGQWIDLGKVKSEIRNHYRSGT